MEGNCKLKEQNQPQSETAQTSANTETGTIAFSQIVVETLVPPFPLRRTRLPIYSAVERSSYLWLRSTQCATVFHTPRCSLQPISFLLRSEWFTCLQQQRRFDSLISLCYVWSFQISFGIMRSNLVKLNRRNWVWLLPPPSSLGFLPPSKTLIRISQRLRNLSLEPKFNNGFRIFDSAPNPKREFNINCEFRMNQLFTLYFSFSIPRLVCTAGNLPLLWTCSHVWTLVTMAISKVQFFAQMDSVPSNAMRRKEPGAEKGESRDFFC